MTPLFKKENLAALITTLRELCALYGKKTSLLQKISLRPLRLRVFALALTGY